MPNTRHPGTAMITGASSGIGAVYADRLAMRGHDLILVARDVARLEALAEKLAATYGVAAAVLSADLATASGIESVERRLAADQAITVFVNNAGIARMGRLTGMPVSDITALIQINVLAAARLAAAAGRAFASRQNGRVVNIASVLALNAESFNPIYNGTKAFLLSLSQSMSNELEAQGVQVQAVLPGATRTEIWSRAGGDLAALPPEIVMDATEMVDAALVGFDRGERVTIPSLPDAQEFEAFTRARLKMAPNLSHAHPASRYRTENGA